MNWLYISKKTALEWGLTHHGSVYGVPAWVAEDGNEVVNACPKMPVMNLWLRLCDFIYEAATHFMPQNAYLETPLKVGKKIE